MGNVFWVYYQRKADGQDFHERLTAEGFLKLLSRGGIRLCGLEAVDGDGAAILGRYERRAAHEDGRRA